MSKRHLLACPECMTQFGLELPDDDKDARIAALEAQLTETQEREVGLVWLVGFAKHKIEQTLAGQYPEGQALQAALEKVEQALADMTAECVSETDWAKQYFDQWQAARQSRARLVGLVRERRGMLEDAIKMLNIHNVLAIQASNKIDELKAENALAATEPAR